MRATVHILIHQECRRWENTRILGVYLSEKEAWAQKIKLGAKTWAIEDLLNQLESEGPSAKLGRKFVEVCDDAELYTIANSQMELPVQGEVSRDIIEALRIAEATLGEHEFIAKKLISQLTNRILEIPLVC